MEGVSRAALGHVLCIWSFVADQGSGGVVTEGEMKALGRGNPNASRWLKELLKARFLEPHPDGYVVHDYRDWNKLPDDADEGANRNAYEGANRNAYEGANRDADNHQSMIPGRYAPVPRAIETQDPRLKTQEREGARCSAPAAQEFSEHYRAWCWQSGTKPAVIRGAALSAAVEQAQSVAHLHSCDFATATARLMAAAHKRSQQTGQGVALALRDCEVPRPADTSYPDPEDELRRAMGVQGG